jgi:succinate dehydrogenase / fumarate reductase iron-sulfur subunit
VSQQERREDDCLSFTVKIWRQNGPKDKGQMVSYPLEHVRPEMSFLEMLDVLNGELERKGEELPISFDSDCREGICGMCGLVINGVAHGLDTARPPASSICAISPTVLLLL